MLRKSQDLVDRIDNNYGERGYLSFVVRKPESAYSQHGPADQCQVNHKQNRFTSKKRKPANTQHASAKIMLSHLSLIYH
jgi:hypothetical protein